MDRWSRTTVLFAGCEPIERALDYIAERNGFDRFTFEPSILSPRTSERWLHSKPESATTWLIALQAKSAAITLVKSLPLHLMAGNLLPSRSRPMIAMICGLLSCCGIHYSLEDHASYCIAANQDGDCQISGIPFEEEDSIWAPMLQWKNEGHGEIDSTEVKGALQRHGFTFNSNFDAGKEFLNDFAKLSDADMSDAVVHQLITSGQSPEDWIVLQYQHRQSCD